MLRTYFTYSIVDGDRDDDDCAAVFAAASSDGVFVQCGQAGRSEFAGLGPSWWDDVVYFCEFVSEHGRDDAPAVGDEFLLWDDQEPAWRRYVLAGIGDESTEEGPREPTYRWEERELVPAPAEYWPVRDIDRVAIATAEGAIEAALRALECASHVLRGIPPAWDWYPARLGTDPTAIVDKLTEFNLNLAHLRQYGRWPTEGR